MKTIALANGLARVGDMVRVVREDGFLLGRGLPKGSIARLTRIIEPYEGFHGGMLGPYVEVNGHRGGCGPDQFQLVIEQVTLAERIEAMARRYAAGKGDFGGTGIADELRALLAASAAPDAQCGVCYWGPSIPYAHGARCTTPGPHPGERHTAEFQGVPFSWWTEEEKVMLRAAARA